VIPQTATPLVDAFTFDVVESMRISYPGQVFRHAIQNGVEGIVDAVQLDPPVVSITGLLGNMPIISPTGSQPLALLNPLGDRMTTLLELLLFIRALKIPVRLVCSWLRPLTDRWPSVVDAERTSTSGNTMGVTVNFDKTRIVNSLTIPVQQDSDLVALGEQVVEYGPVSFEG
jgi:hypothetical protein